MGATIKPAIWPKRVSHAPAVCCDCKSTQWVAYEEYYDPRRHYTCKSCGESGTFEPEFYPREFPLTEMCMTYSSMGILLSKLGIEFEYAGSFEPEQIKDQIHKLADTGFYEPMLQIFNQATTYKVKITWG